MKSQEPLAGDLPLKKTNYLAWRVHQAKCALHKQEITHHYNMRARLRHSVTKH